MLLNNYAVRSANQNRSLGGNLNPTYNYSPSKMRTFYLYDNGVSGVIETQSLPEEGLKDNYTLLLPPTTGGMATYGYISGDGEVTTASGQNGLAGQATLSGVGTITNAAGGLIVELQALLSGSGNLTASISGQLTAVATLTGSGSLTAAIGAMAGLEATLAGQGLMTASQQAKGNMEATIYVNNATAEIQQLVDAIWNALAAEYNASGTMGNKLNGAGSAGDPWTTDITAYDTAGTAGKILKDRLSKNQFLGLK